MPQLIFFTLKSLPSNRWENSVYKRCPWRSELYSYLSKTNIMERLLAPKVVYKLPFDAQSFQEISSKMRWTSLLHQAEEKINERICHKTSSNAPYMAQNLHFRLNVQSNDQIWPFKCWFIISNGNVIPFATLQHTMLQCSVHQVDSGNLEKNRYLEIHFWSHHFDN